MKKRSNRVPHTEGANLLFQRRGEIGGMSAYMSALQSCPENYMLLRGHDNEVDAAYNDFKCFLALGKSIQPHSGEGNCDS